MKRHEQLVWVALVGLLVWGCEPGPDDEWATIRAAGPLTLYEGLPHPAYEPEVVKQEEANRPTVRLQGFAFYQETLALKPEDAQALRQILADPATYQAFQGEKKCGGFHPDHAVEWSTGGKLYRALICLGCHEILVVGPRGDRRYDLASGPYQTLRTRLKPYRKNRPEPKGGP